MSEAEVFGAIGGEGFSRLTHEFYKQIPEDDVLGPMYSGRDMDAAEKRLRDFLIFRFGGPPMYIEERGHPRLRMRHAPFEVNEAARDRWLQMMDRALAVSDLPAEPEAVLRAFFHSTANFLINRAS